jgi:hypothetical protein
VWSYCEGYNDEYVLLHPPPPTILYIYISYLCKHGKSSHLLLFSLFK